MRATSHLGPFLLNQPCTHRTQARLADPGAKAVLIVSQAGVLKRMKEMTSGGGATPRSDASGSRGSEGDLGARRRKTYSRAAQESSLEPGLRELRRLTGQTLTELVNQL